jgi:malate dehydrogenase
VVSRGEYQLPDGLITSYPCRTDGRGNWGIVTGLEVNAFSRGKIAKTIAELEDERNIVKHLLG